MAKKKQLDSLVSVIIPTYKRADMVYRAIDSVINQTYENIEILVIDDNDPHSVYREETEKVLSKYANNPKVKYLKHEKNLNGAAARNTGIKKSKGEYLCFLDDDDLFLSEKIEKQLKFLNEHPQYKAVYCGWERDHKIVKPTNKGDLSFGLLSGSDLIYTNTIMIKKEAVIKAGGWDSRFRRNQEAAFLLKFFSAGYTIGVINDVLVKFDTSDRSNASNPQKNEEDFRFYLQMHEELIKICTKTNKNARKIIYSYRYRGVLLNYIKSKKYIGALRFYTTTTFQFPLTFNKYLFIYFIRRIHRKAI